VLATHSRPFADNPPAETLYDDLDKSYFTPRARASDAGYAQPRVVARVHRLPLLDIVEPRSTVHVRLSLKWLDTLPLSGGLISCVRVFSHTAPHCSFNPCVHSWCTLECEEVGINFDNIVQTL